MRCLSLSVSVLALGLVSVGIVPQPSVAAPLPAAYSAAAGGDLAAIDLDQLTGTDLAGARLGVSQSTMNGGTSPAASATASNLAAAVTGLGIAVDSTTQTAPPDNPNADTGTLGAGSAPGLLSLGLLTTSVQARSQDVIACRPGGGMMANSQVQSTGVILNPTGVGIVADTGDSSTSGVVAIYPQPLSDPLNRAILSTATGTITSTSFLNGSVDVAVGGNSTLQAFATGEQNGASVNYNPGTVTVNTVSNPSGTTVDLGESVPFDVPNGRVVVTVNEPTVTESSDGRTASGTVAVVTAEVTAGTGTPLATATVDLLPLRAQAVAPPGGIDCQPPPPVLNLPAQASTVTDTTPTFTGTAYPGAEVEIFIDGDSIGTTTADNAGDFSFTPTTPLGTGFHNYTAAQTTDGGTTLQSSGNGFAILGPPVLETPADGTVTSDTTPTYTGFTFPGADVDILIDSAADGSTTADGNGRFSYTSSIPLTPGPYQVFARATVNLVQSPPSSVTDFVVDTAAPAAPTLSRPADGEVTDDPTPTFTGSAEPGAEVAIFVDGTPIGTTNANGGGAFSFTPTAPLADGPHEAFVGATDAAGNDSPPSNTNAFRIDTEAPAAPVITSPDDGSTTTDRTFPIRGTAEPGSQVIIIRDGAEIGSTVADEDGNFTFDVPPGLAPVGRYGFSARAVDEAGNSSGAAEPVYVEVLGASATLDDGASVDDDAGQSLADTGGPQGWISLAAALGALAGAGILAATRWRRRGSPAGL